MKREIYDLILSSFSDDNQRNKIWGWTKGGAFELERERENTVKTINFVINRLDK